MCPAELHLSPHEQLDEWVWADEAGHQLGDDPDLPPDPYGRLKRLSDAILAASARAKKGKAELTWVYWRAGQEYGALKVRLDFGGTWHTHYPREHGPAISAGPVPEHCGWPMWLRPSGWQCRQCRARQELDAPAELAA